MHPRSTPAPRACGRRIAIAAPEAGAHSLTAFAGAIDPTGAAIGEVEANIIAASIALPRFHDGEDGFDTTAFETAIRTLVHALDAAHGAGRFAAPRRSSFGSKGCAHCCMRMGIAYDSAEARALRRRDRRTRSCCVPFRRVLRSRGERRLSRLERRQAR